ncbi:MAG: acetylxylan esterase, partial [Phycisphaerae bacterium]
MRYMLCILLLAFCTTTLRAQPAPVGPMPVSFFDVPDFKTLPPNIQVLSEKTVEGKEGAVKVMEFYFAGAPFNNKPTRLYGFYCRPEKSGIYPGVVEVHGAGLGVLGPDSGIQYAKNGFCCITIDWAGRCPERKEPRKAPYSEFDSPGNMSYALPEADKAKAPPHGWQLYGVETDGIRNGVKFVRRAVMFLQSRPEVNPDKLCISGMSAGAHLTLLTLGIEPAFKAAAVKYGRAYIRDMWFGGYFGPIVMCAEAQQSAWLAAFDPKHHI